MLTKRSQSKKYTTFHNHRTTIQNTSYTQTCIVQNNNTPYLSLSGYLYHRKELNQIIYTI